MRRVLRFIAALIPFVSSMPVQNHWYSSSKIPKTSNVLGLWKLHSSSNRHLQDKTAKLEILPDLSCIAGEQCQLKFSIQQPLFLSTSFSRYILGTTEEIKSKTMRIKWRTKKQSEVILFGIGMAISVFDLFSASPKGSVRTIRWSLLNTDTLRIMYDGHVYVFGRFNTNGSTAALTIEIWICMQIMSLVFAHFIAPNQQ